MRESIITSDSNTREILSLGISDGAATNLKENKQNIRPVQPIHSLRPTILTKHELTGLYGYRYSMDIWNINCIFTVTYELNSNVHWKIWIFLSVIYKNVIHIFLKYTSRLHFVQNIYISYYPICGQLSSILIYVS